MIALGFHRFDRFFFKISTFRKNWAIFVNSALATTISLVISGDFHGSWRIWKSRNSCIMMAAVQGDFKLIFFFTTGKNENVQDRALLTGGR